MSKHLEKYADDDSRPISLREAALAGQEKLNHYYGLVKSSMHTVVATGMPYFVFFFVKPAWV
jgi:hypothetical protein